MKLLMAAMLVGACSKSRPIDREPIRVTVNHVTMEVSAIRKSADVRAVIRIRLRNERVTPLTIRIEQLPWAFGNLSVRVRSGSVMPDYSFPFRLRGGEAVTSIQAGGEIEGEVNIQDYVLNVDQLMGEGPIAVEFDYVLRDESGEIDRFRWNMILA